MDSSTHAVPQNVTDFQFHLVGDMTLKQFGYLGAGLGIAYLIFIIFGSVAPLVAYPLVALFALSGIGLAFIPIQERPLDYWLTAFIKAIFKPTQLKYSYGFFKKDDPRFGDRINIYLNNNVTPISPIHSEKMAIPKNIQVPIPQSPIVQIPTTQKIQQPIKPVITPIQPQPRIQPQPQVQVQIQPSHNPNFIPQQSTPRSPVYGPPPASANINASRPSVFNQQQARPQPIVAQLPQSFDAKNMPSSEEIRKTVELASKAQNIQSEIIENQHILNQIKITSGQQGIDKQAFASEFQKVIGNLQKLNEQANQISKELSSFSKTTPPNIVKVVPTVKSQITPNISLTSTPNIVNGIITDVLGNYVEGAIIVAHDKQGLPVRALKSNKLGQFVAATPLPSGTYTITIEKDDLAFDAIQLELQGALLNPILVQARKPERNII